MRSPPCVALEIENAEHDGGEREIEQSVRHLAWRERTSALNADLSRGTTEAESQRDGPGNCLRPHGAPP